MSPDTSDLMMSSTLKESPKPRDPQSRFGFDLWNLQEAIETSKACIFKRCHF